ncbi:MAG: malto-oligosyltrehalose trehalohydrolase [Leptolyngbyaceae cyanobacterium]
MGRQIGAIALTNNRCEFTVWAPLLQGVAVKIWDSPETSTPRLVPLAKGDRGYWQNTVDDVPPGTLYKVVLASADGEVERPDPASRYQPEGVHGRSQVMAHDAYTWADSEWQNLPLAQYICYELHVGTFTPLGTFEAIIPRLDALKTLGVNAVELMPVAQFPGDRNWGYDGVYPYAVQTSYGGVAGLKRLVDACHQLNMAVILDVVYNHFGPEGNYTRDFGPYFTERYNTPWGAAINFDDAYSTGVRDFCIENVLYWLREFHIDALRLDAIHAIYDYGAKHILADMATAVDRLAEVQQRPYYLIAESDLNDGRIIRESSQGGYDIDAQWSDDFHHSVHALLTAETTGYYADFGQLEHLAAAWRRSFVYNWRYSPFRKRFHGNDVSDRPGSQFVVCVQNHDQVGNRMLGERLSQLTTFAGLKLAAANLLLAPAIPMLFMGEEYGETAPFLYFIDHTDADLREAVRAGRKREFAAFHQDQDPPDAASLETFVQSTLNWEQRQQGEHGILLEFYQTLLALRRSLPPLLNFDRAAINVEFDEALRWLGVRRWHGPDEVLIWMNFNSASIHPPCEMSTDWQKQLDSADQRWRGPGCLLPEQFSEAISVKMPPLSVAVFHRANH